MAVSLQALTDQVRRLLNHLYDDGASTDPERVLILAECELADLQAMLEAERVTAVFTDGHSAMADLLERHTDYPHHPGRHHGCTACEARCHCDTEQGTEPCVFEGRHRRRAGAGDPMRRSRLTLTEAGRRWVREDPLNRLVRILDGRTSQARGTFTLFDAERVAGDRGRVIDLVTDGYATLHRRGDQVEVTFGTATGRDEFARPRDFVLLPTTKIRRMLPA